MVLSVCIDYWPHFNFAAKWTEMISFQQLSPTQWFESFQVKTSGLHAIFVISLFCSSNFYWSQSNLKFKIFVKLSIYPQPIWQLLYWIEVNLPSWRLGTLGKWTNSCTPKLVFSMNKKGLSVDSCTLGPSNAMPHPSHLYLKTTLLKREFCCLKTSFVL